MNIAQNAVELVGNTPLLRLNRLEKNLELHAALLVKLESKNPSGSVKDRIAVNMLLEAARKGLLKEGDHIVEPTSGNTGIGLAAAAAALGYGITLVMSESLSVERRKLMLAYGADLVLTEGAKGTKGAIQKAYELKAEHPDWFMPQQFENQDNPAAHYRATGPEIWNDTDGQIDVFVAGVGTGGTISGVGRYLKEKKPSVRVVAVEPEASAVLSGKPAGPHPLQGIGAGFVPATLDTTIYDEIVPIAADEAIAATRMLGRTEGVLTGYSGGACLAAAIRIARRDDSKGKTIVLVLPDGGERYLSTPLFG
jgi:cysteine synthase A